MNRALFIVAALAALGLLVANTVFYTVDQRERVLLFRLGEVIAADLPPGLHMKYPFVNNVVKYDGRIQTLDRGPVRYQTSELKNVVVDSFVKWRIADTRGFFVAVGAGDVNARLSQIVNDLSRSAFGKRTVQAAVSGDRNEIMDTLRAQANKRAAEFGVEVVDVRIKRVDLPPEVSSSVYTRMEAERKRVAAELRAKGAEEGERIRSQTDKERTLLLAQARRDGLRIRGEGEARAAARYIEEIGQDTAFYDFYRSLEAYRNSIGTSRDLLVLEPTSNFFKHFDAPTAGDR
ncbi:MAG: protease modulator HflC [Immundisolibacter sp.]|uniref:protease modulator HflC n=1 Tax=Immundisolibacter sp. TaxID=1934948 RepID=UPI003561A3C2